MNFSFVFRFVYLALFGPGRYCTYIFLKHKSPQNTWASRLPEKSGAGASPGPAPGQPDVQGRPPPSRHMSQLPPSLGPSALSCGPVRRPRAAPGPRGTANTGPEGQVSDRGRARRYLLHASSLLTLGAALEVCIALTSPCGRRKRPQAGVSKSPRSPATAGPGRDHRIGAAGGPALHACGAQRICSLMLPP